MIDPSNNKDYQDFLSSKGSQPSKYLDNRILGFIHEDLNPNSKIVFSKLVTIQLLIGALTLLFCPQFNLSLTNNHELFHYFHHNFGEYICMIICGSIFMGTGAVFASTILSINEIKLIRSKEFLFYPTLSILILPMFLIFGAEMYLNLTLFWLIGTTISGVIFIEAGFRIKKSLAFYS